MDRLSNILKQRLEAGQLAPVDHLSVDMLTAFVERALKGPERDVVVSHLSVCPTCREAVILALPEIANEKAQAAAASSIRFRLPAAMRWASVAAAFAVAVGVGILSYEHESGRPPAGVLTAPVAPQQVTNRDSVQENVRQKEAKIEAGAAKSKMDLNDGLMARDRMPARKILQKKAASGGYETQAKQPSTEAGMEQNQPDIANGFVTARKTLSAAEYAKSAPVPTTPAPSAATQMVEVEPAQQTKSAPTATQSVQLSAAAPGITGGMAQSSPKSFNGIALGGPMFRKSLARSNEIVRWTVSSAGKLLREAQNGAKRLIEPAPGLTVRAVAAKGIEVWAGGVQPDTSAAQWQQRPVLFHSSDAGETWTKVDGPWTAPITRLDLVSEDALTVSAEDGTWSTTDAGKSWVKQ